MNTEAALSRENLVYMEELYQLYIQDPASVALEWRQFFESQDQGAPINVVASARLASPVQQEPPALLGMSLEPTSGLTQPLRQLEPEDAILAFLQHSPLFQHMESSYLAKIATIAHAVHFGAGEALARAGSVHQDVYFITSGSVGIYRNGEELASLGMGEAIGELAVFDPRPRSADILAKNEAGLIRIARQDLFELIRSDRHLAEGLLRTMASRLRDSGYRQEAVDRLVRAYRERGHVMAHLDPLGHRPGEHPELTLEHYGFKQADLEQKFTVKLGAITSDRPLREILDQLQRIYCRSIGVQFMHIDDLGIQEWLRLRLEAEHPPLNRKEQLRILAKLTDAEVFENFIHRKFVGAKRFSLEGGESIIPLLDVAIEEAGYHGIDEVLIGMAHRGRLNVLVNIMGKPADQVFREFFDSDPNMHRGDVKYHLGFGCDRETASGRKVHISLCFNPSHLEFVGPVVLGRTRAKQDRFGDLQREKALPLVIHGDAAFIGQGVVQEMLNLSELEGYTVGGTVHVIHNNQIGFTTGPEQSRSTQYATDIARMLQVPIFHVNGENPEAVANVIRLAMDFRKAFKKDVVIDMYCYRKYGHNEGDDPTFTQPLMYEAIRRRKSVRAAYVDNLLKLGELSKQEAEAVAENSRRHFEQELEEAQSAEHPFVPLRSGKGIWSDFVVDSVWAPVETGVPKQKLAEWLRSLGNLPEGFHANSKVVRFLEAYEPMAKGELPLNWGAGEALAFGSLLAQGYPVRITGQDAERGTFSHRHAVLHDVETDLRFVPLRQLQANQVKLEIHNSSLSEVAVLAFEYGYSLDMPEGLTIWEAQFGDFCNVAQVIIDQFIASGEEKWKRFSGLCLFLPHGYEGQGPEHSSARLERFLMLAASDNIQVCNLTTPAQLFHCLRRQVLRKIRKPLVIMSPKSLLRHPEAVSGLDDFASGAFQPLIDDAYVTQTSEVKRVLLCSGKIYYELEAYRREKEIREVAILRLEQYYPFPLEILRGVLARFPANVPLYWVQEEPWNMGAWPFMRLNLGVGLEGNGTHELKGITRPESASPATGSSKAHKVEQELLISTAFEGF